MYVPLLAITGFESETFEPMALTVIIALVVPLTFVPAAIAIAIWKPVCDNESLIVRRLKSVYAPLLRTSIARRLPVLAGAALLFACAVFLFGHLGQEFTPMRDEKNIVMEVRRAPSTALA